MEDHSLNFLEVLTDEDRNILLRSILNVAAVPEKKSNKRVLKKLTRAKLPSLSFQIHNIFFV